MSDPQSEESADGAAAGPEQHHLRGYVLAAGAAIMWGVSGVITKYLLGRDMEPDELLIFRTMLAAAILFAWLGLTSRDLLRVSLKDLPYFALLGAIGLVANQGFYYLALSMVSVGYALLLQYMAPVFLMVYGVLSKTERMTGGKAIAAALAIGGSVAMVLGQEGGLARASFGGTLAALGSAVGFAFYTGYGKYGLRKYDPRTMMAYAFLFAGLMWITIRPLWTLDWESYDLSTWALFLYLATVATVLPFGLFLASLRYLEPSRSSLTSMLEPVVAAVIAWLWLGEKMTAAQAAGGAAVLGGVILLQMERLLIARLLLKDLEKGGV
ncbi:MAG: EamA family transporter [Acidobacteriota bacterium]|nr:MAG: EamA family transporter [Acidobacteriota bacterium]